MQVELFEFELNEINDKFLFFFSLKFHGQLAVFVSFQADPIVPDTWSQDKKEASKSREILKRIVQFSLF